MNDKLQSILERRVANGEPFKLKVEIGWEAKKLFGDGETFKYYMAFNAYKVPPASIVVAGSSPVFPIADFMRSVTRRALDKMEFATTHGSGLEFLKIHEVIFTAVSHMRTVAISDFPDFPELAGGCSVKLPKTLLTKHCVINTVNTDDFCFRYAIMAWALGDKLLHPERPASYNSNASATAGRPRKDFVPEFIDVGIDFSMLS